VPRLAYGLWLAAVAVGVAAEWVAFGWNDAGDWLPDLAVGWTFIACGLVAWSRRPESRTGVLLTVTGFAWFVGNFAESLVYLHRGPLFHSVLAYPNGRLRSRIDRVAVTAGYAAALVPAVGRSEIAMIAVGALLVAVAGWSYLRAVGRERRARVPVLQAASVLGIALAAGAAARLAFPAGDANEAVLLGYEAALVAVAVGLLVGLLRAPWERAPVADLVVELGDVSSGTLREALARALGDPTLRVGYRLPGTGSYVDAAGDPVELPQPGANRAVTFVERDGQPLAALVHDPAVIDDPGLVDGVAAATRLGVANIRLQGEVRAQLADLVASRRRLLEAGDDERRRLELRLRDGAQRRLEAVAQSLARARPAVGSTSRERIDEAQGQLGRALADLHELALGLHPRELVEDGLKGAVGALAARSPVPVELDVGPGRVGPETEVAAFFLCSEALANVAKYASASRVMIRIALADGLLVVEVADDGVGGADSARGSGLRGLKDRIEALGGTLRVDSRPGSGTRLEAAIPLADDPRCAT
jgi:signal transduction histidine kinase